MSVGPKAPPDLSAEREANSWFWTSPTTKDDDHLLSSPENPDRHITVYESSFPIGLLQIFEYIASILSKRPSDEYVPVIEKTTWVKQLAGKLSSTEEMERNMVASHKKHYYVKKSDLNRLVGDNPALREDVMSRTEMTFAILYQAVKGESEMRDTTRRV